MVACIRCSFCCSYRTERPNERTARGQTRPEVTVEAETYGASTASTARANGLGPSWPQCCGAVGLAAHFPSLPHIHSLFEAGVSRFRQKATRGRLALALNGADFRRLLPVCCPRPRRETSA